MLFLGRLLRRVAGEEAALQQLQVSDARTVLVLFALEASHFGQQHCPLLLQLPSLLLQLEHIGLKHVYVFLQFRLLAAFARFRWLVRLPFML